MQNCGKLGKEHQTFKKEQSEEIFEKIMGENVPKLMSETQSQVHKARRTPMQINATETMCKHIIFQL